MKAQHRLVLQGFLNGIVMQAGPIEGLCGARQIALALALVLVEDWRSRKAIPKRMAKELLQLPLSLRRDRAMAFVDDKGDAQSMEALRRRRILLGFPIVPLHDDLQLLDSRDNHQPVFVLELLQKLVHVIGIVYINAVIFGIGLERERRLLVKVFAVNEENRLVDARDKREILGYGIGSQRLARTGRMPDKARLLSGRRPLDRLNGMDLIGPQQDELMALGINDTVMTNHLMRRRNPQDFPRKLQIILHRLILLIDPSRQELLIEIRTRIGRDIARITAIGHHKHLHHAKEPAELALETVFLDLTECIHKRMLLILELNMNHRQAINEQRHIKTALAVIRILLIGNELVDNLIGRTAARNLTVADCHKMNRPLAGILARKRDNRLAILPRQPQCRLIRALGHIEHILPNLMELGIGNRLPIKGGLIVLIELIAEIRPKRRFIPNILAIRPLRHILRQLPYQFPFHSRFTLCHTSAPRLSARH